MKDGEKDTALHLLADIRNILLGIALMIAGLGSILFSMAIVHDFFLGLGAVLLICGLVKVLSLSLDREDEAKAAQDAQPPESATPGASSNEPNTQKED